LERHTTFVSDAIRRAVVRHLPIAALGLAACGGSITPEGSPSGDGGGSAVEAGRTDAGTYADAADADGPPSCMVTSSTPVQFTSTAVCRERTFRFDGTASQCGADPSGSLSLARCQQLCPPTPDDGGGFPVTSCGLWMPGALRCLYGFCAQGSLPQR
jgi:hypothetical protein